MRRFLFLLTFVLLTIVIISYSLAVKAEYLPYFFKQQIVSEIPKQTERDIQPEQIKIPEHIPYAFLLLRYANEKKQGRILKIKEKIGLDQEGFIRFQNIADGCNRELEITDNRAKEIIETFQKQYPPGKIPPGIPPPQLPPQLVQLQETRNQIILRCRDNFRMGLGGRNSLNLEMFVQNEITQKISTKK